MKTKIILFSFAIFSLIFACLPQAGEAQWTQTNGPLGGSISSLVASGSNIFAGTSDSGVYLSTNNGTNWTQSGLNGQEVITLAVSGSNVFAGTYNNGVYRSTNNGQNWTQTLSGQTINALAINGSYILAGTTNGIYQTTNNGQSWIQLPGWN